MAKNKRNIILAILLVLILAVIALLIGRFTYSYFSAQVSEDLKSEGETTASGDTIIFSKGNNLSIAASTDNFYVGSGDLADTTNPSVRLIASNKTNEAVASYYAGIVINKNTFTYSGSNAELILTVRDENNNLVTTSSDTLEYVTVNGVSGFDITGKTGAFNIASNHPISTTSSTTGTTHTWTFTLTFVNLDTDQSINENATLDMQVVLQKNEIEMPTLAEICEGKTLANCIKENVYTADGENGLYYHDGLGTYTNSDQEAGDYSYRYTGLNPDNYVCFGSDAESCPNDNLYRIIGIFDDDKDSNYQIKLIKADYADSNLLGTDGDYSNRDSDSIDIYYWNSNTSNNNWSESQLNTVNLNYNFWNNLGSTWQDLIATTEWKVGGNIYSSIYNSTIKNVYQNEIVSPAVATTYSDEIGLLYASDYGYATTPENWLTIVSVYYGSNNWLSLGISEWTITRNSEDNISAFYVGFNGAISLSESDVFVNPSALRPSFYLKTNVKLLKGTGTYADPYRLTM